MKKHSIFILENNFQKQQQQQQNLSVETHTHQNVVAMEI